MERGEGTSLRGDEREKLARKKKGMERIFRSEKGRAGKSISRVAYGQVGKTEKIYCKKVGNSSIKKTFVINI